MNRDHVCIIDGKFVDVGSPACGSLCGCHPVIDGA